MLVLYLVLYQFIIILKNILGTLTYYKDLVLQKIIETMNRRRFTCSDLSIGFIVSSEYTNSMYNKLEYLLDKMSLYNVRIKLLICY